MIGPRNRIAVGARLVADLVRIMADRYRTTAVVRSSDTVVIGRGHLARARYRGVSREGVDHRRRLVIHCDRLALAAAVAAAVGRMIGPRNGIEVGTHASRSLVSSVADRYRSTAIIRRSHRAVIGRRHFARARYRRVSREGVDHWRGLVIHRSEEHTSELQSRFG